MEVLRALAVTAATLLLAAFPAQAGSRSHAADPFAALARGSAFLQGYLHGYETGFHDGDLDYQLGRAPNPERYHHDGDGYQHAFGDRDTYRHGFRQGFRVAYADAVGGRSFRAAASVRELQAALDPSQNRASRALDTALANGYQKGLTQGLRDGRAGAPFSGAATACQGQQPHVDCAAFAGGFRLGYADGYTNQRPAATVTTASK